MKTMELEGTKGVVVAFVVAACTSQLVLACFIAVSDLIVYQHGVRGLIVHDGVEGRSFTDPPI